MKTRASSEETSSIDTNELITDLKEKVSYLSKKNRVGLVWFGFVCSVLIVGFFFRCSGMVLRTNLLYLYMEEELLLLFGYLPLLLVPSTLFLW